MKSSAKFGKLATCAILAVAMLGSGIAPAGAYELLGRVTQAAAPNVEASIIYKYACNGSDEHGRQIFIYQYTARPGFRVIVPPAWGQAIGGRDFPRFQDAERVLVQACNKYCARINPDLADLGTAKRAFNDAYTNYLRDSRNQAAYGEYKCAEVLLHYLERTAQGGN